MAFYIGTATVVVDAEDMEEAEALISEALSQDDYELIISKDE